MDFSVFDNSFDVIVVYDSNGIIRYGNSAFYLFTELSPARAINKLDISKVFSSIEGEPLRIADFVNVKETTPSYMDFIIGGPSTGTTTSAAKSAGETGDVTTATVHNAQGETGSASYTGNDSVLHHWLSEGIAGWRLDVIDELPQQFSRAFYKELKRTNPDAVVIGEVWEDASNKVAYDVSREYLSMPEIDGAMNYPLRSIIFDYLLHHDDANITTARIESLRENYPIQHFYAMMNLISSHDSQRALTVLGEYPYHDDMTASEQSKAHLSPDQYKLGKQRLLLATLFQMTLPGVPSIYYGDEIGMRGGHDLQADPHKREPFDWYAPGDGIGMTRMTQAVYGAEAKNLLPNDGISLEEQQGQPGSLYELYKQLIQIRKSNSILFTGQYQRVGTPAGSYGRGEAFSRVSALN